MASLTIDEQISKLEDMLARGVRRSKYSNGTEVEFESSAQLRTTLDRLKAQKANTSGKRLRVSRMRLGEN